MDKPLISICIPAYNGEAYIRACLDACLQQSFTDFEIVICDDGSTDNTPLLIQQFAAHESRLRFYTNATNLGLVDNWNRCIDLANGEWIKLLFQDDLMHPDCLQRFSQHLAEGFDLLACKRHFVLDPAASVQARDYYERQVRTLENTGKYRSRAFSPATISRLAAENICLNFIAEPSLTLFRKELVARIGPFDRQLRQICDLEFYLRVASNYGLYYIPEQLCDFRIHAASTTEKNIHSPAFWPRYLESLVCAAKLLAKVEFQALRAALPFFLLMKLRLYVKYKSYLAWSHAASAADLEAYLSLEKQYAGLFFKKRARFVFALLRALKP